MSHKEIKKDQNENVYEVQWVSFKNVDFFRKIIVNTGKPVQNDKNEKNTNLWWFIRKSIENRFKQEKKNRKSNFFIMILTKKSSIKLLFHMYISIV